MRKVCIALIILLALVLFIGWFLFFSRPSSKYGIKALSISSDGRYIVGNKQTDLYLWDVEMRIKQRVAKNVNIYSAYFIKNSPYYMYQDLENVVHVKNVEGQEVKTIPLDFPTYGHVMTTDLKRYFASDKDWRIVKVEGSKITVVKGMDESDGFYNGKILNLFLSSDDSELLSSGISVGGGERPGSALFTEEEIPLMNWPHHLSSVTLWDTRKDKAVLLFRSNNYKTTATLSPDQTYLLVVDEGGWSSQINLVTKQYFQSVELSNSVFVSKNGDLSTGAEVQRIVGSGEIKDLFGHYPRHSLRVFFISPSEYIRFNTNSAYAFLYSIKNDVPLAYLDLGTDPYPSVHDYSRNASIDTAPAAHRVVIGKHSQPGIMVYDYDPEAKTLTKIWDSK